MGRMTRMTLVPSVIGTYLASVLILSSLFFFFFLLINVFIYVVQLHSSEYKLNQYTALVKWSYGAFKLHSSSEW